MQLSRMAAVKAPLKILLVRSLVARYGNAFALTLLQQTDRQKASFSTWSSTEHQELGRDFCRRNSSHSSENDYPELGASKKTPLRYEIPKNVRQKVTSASDAVALVRSGDTICVSGFLAQGAPEAILKALGKRYEDTCSPNNLTLLFGGGPGDGDNRGLNHLAKMKDDGSCPPMLSRTIGSLYIQIPKVAELVLSNAVEAWTLPFGSISRMIRAQATHSPGHITNVGLGTYIDPDISGGAANEAAQKSELHEKLVRKITIGDQISLMYKALPIDVAIVRGTMSDAQGNITMEEESLLCDQKIMAVAAKNSGGIVIAQVKYLAASGSLSSRSVGIPGSLVDCVVVVDEEEHDELHGMSFVETYNPALTGAIVAPLDERQSMGLNIRKIIARRAFFGLKPDKIVNLGIGLPEGIASVAAEEGMLQYVTMSTEPGVFGGQAASGRSFGPAVNASALIETNQMFDFYDGGGLDMCFLGAAEVSRSGDVNASRLSENRVTGPGGFIDISQSTSNVCFMTPLTTQGLEVSCPGDGTLNIKTEGAKKKFVSEVLEKTFSGDEAVRRGQQVFYVTERAVFRRTAKNDTIELIEIAPGIDLQRDIIDQMDFAPAISPNLTTMDPRIFKEARMKVTSELFGSLEDRCTYHADDHIMYLDLFGVSLNTADDIRWFHRSLCEILDPLVQAKGPIDMVIQYDGFDVGRGLEDQYLENAADSERRFYKSVKRYTGAAFRREKLGKHLRMSEWDTDELYDEFDVNHDGILSLEEIRNGIKSKFQIHLTPSQLRLFQKSPDVMAADRTSFAAAVEDMLRSTN